MDAPKRSIAEKPPAEALRGQKEILLPIEEKKPAAVKAAELERSMRRKVWVETATHCAPAPGPLW
jgi:hypothetical protein